MYRERFSSVRVSTFGNFQLSRTQTRCRYTCTPCTGTSAHDAVCYLLRRARVYILPRVCRNRVRARVVRTTAGRTFSSCAERLLGHARATCSVGTKRKPRGDRPICLDGRSCFVRDTTPFASYHNNNNIYLYIATVLSSCGAFHS